MPDLDLYAIHGLDRSAPSQALAAQLTAQLNTAPDPLARQRIDTARTILGDPQRRARYDAQLSDPAAPPITEATLAAIAGRPVAAEPSGMSAAFSQPNVRLAAIAAAVLGLVLIIVISAVSCGGGDDSSGPATTVGADGSMTTTPGTTTKADKLTLESARAIRNDLPVADLSAKLKVVGQVSLAGQSGMVSDKVYLTQPNGQAVRAYWNGKSSYLSADGYKESHVQSWVDLMITDGGDKLVQTGQVHSEKVTLGENFQGEPATSGALKGVPTDMEARVSSGTFLFAAGAPGQAPREASTSQEQNYRTVLSAFEQGEYVYVTVEGFAGVLIAELEKAQS
ncbi:hypothetical protein [Gordonia sihwensis]|uniref:hypothetical protein n=1 Tax=Gordonia sihwensis TaxID=173559 RepID=UPI003D98C2D4